MKKTYAFGCRKGKNKPSEPKNVIWGSKSAWSCDKVEENICFNELKRPSEPKNLIGRVIVRSEILHEARKNILLEVKKVNISLQSTNMEFGTRNQYGRVIYRLGILYR
jgi:hypothetical protein